MANMCLICLENKGTFCIFENETDCTISQKIFDCTGIEFKEKVDLPDKICENCYVDLSTAYEFRLLAKNSYETLLAQSSNYVENDKIDGEILVKPKNRIEMVICEELKSDTETELENLNGRRSSRRQRNCSRLARGQGKPSEANLTEIENISEEPYPYICELCGNKYKLRRVLSRHLKWHKHEKPHECEICSKRFVASTDLKRHMYQHTGQKPYSCSFCQKRFTAAHSKNNHERTHTGERPFKCERCGKTFTYRHVLSNHILTHTGEKAFECIPCDKKFTKRHHLKDHLGTLIHKIRQEKYENQEVEGELSEEA